MQIGSLRAPAATRSRRATPPALLHQLHGALERELLDRVPGAEARVRLAVGDVGAEAAVLDQERLAADGVRLVEPAERLGRSPSAPLLRLGEYGERLVEGQRQE